MFSRVTGALPSDILGTLGSLGDADLFFLNPNGIVFGPNARLDVGGSFVASTGASFAFADGSEFSAAVLETSLLTVSVPLGLRLDPPPQGNLTNEANLAVGAGQNLTLHGNAIASTVRLAAPGSVAQVLDNQVTLIDNVTPDALASSGDTNLLLQANDGIVVEDLMDDTLLFANGTGQIVLVADADIDGVGDVAMLDGQDTLQTNGRDLTVSGVNLALGTIDTSVQLDGFSPTIIDVDAGGPIPTTGTEGTATFTFTVADGIGRISDLDVRFAAEHTWNSDLDAVLVAPNGAFLTLFSQVGGDGDNFQDTVFDDEADRAVEAGSAPFNDGFQPEGLGGLGIFDGQASAGVWTLRVTDNALGDSGTLWRAGDAAPWGLAQGTQLIITSVAADEGSGGAVTLDAAGNVSVVEVVTAGTGIDGRGGAVDISAGGSILNTTIDASSTEASGGNVSLTAGGDIQIGTPSVASVVLNVDAGGPIPPVGTEGTADFTFTVADGVGPIRDLDVRFSAQHTFDSDLGAVLISPNATTFSLFDGVGQDGDNFQDTVIDDEADLAIEEGSAPFDSSFQPQGGNGLAIFDGESSAGVWKLSVTDTFLAEDSGTLWRAGDAAPWGIAQGTQLLINGSDAIAGLIDTSGNGNSDGGQVQIQAAGAVELVGNIDTSTISDLGPSGNGGDIAITSGSGGVTIEGDLSSTSDAFLDVGLTSAVSGNGGAISISLTSGDVTIEGDLSSDSSSFGDPIYQGDKLTDF